MTNNQSLLLSRLISRFDQVRNRLSRGQNLSLFSLVGLLAVLPISLLLAMPSPGMTQAFFPVTPPITPPITPPPTPQPTPPPVPNHRPMIITKNLLPGRVFRPYRSVVIGSDADPNEQLTMTFKGLPAGLSSQCKVTNNRRSYIWCHLSGRPFQRGTFVVTATLRDQSGASDQRRYRLTIR